MGAQAVRKPLPWVVTIIVEPISPPNVLNCAVQSWSVIYLKLRIQNLILRLIITNPNISIKRHIRWFSRMSIGCWSYVFLSLRRPTPFLGHFTTLPLPRTISGPILLILGAFFPAIATWKASFPALRDNRILFGLFHAIIIRYGRHTTLLTPTSPRRLNKLIFIAFFF